MMLLEAIDARHSVRAYKSGPVADEIRSRLDAFAADCNKEGEIYRSTMTIPPGLIQNSPITAAFGMYRTILYLRERKMTASITDVGITERRSFFLPSSLA